MQKTTDQMLDSLQQAGCRLTRQRVAIIEYLAGRGDHPSVRQIHDDLRSASPSPSLATVYNTLATLVDLGLLQEMEFESTDNRFDTNLRPHINLVCTGCGSITDVDRNLPVDPADLKEKHGFVTTGFRLEYRGTCFHCRSRTSTTAQLRRP